MTATTERRFRSRDWFADPIRSDMTALCSIPSSHMPWEQAYRAHIGRLADGACLDFAGDYRGVAEQMPRHNH